MRLVRPRLVMPILVLTGLALFATPLATSHDHAHDHSQDHTHGHGHSHDHTHAESDKAKATTSTASQTDAKKDTRTMTADRAKSVYDFTMDDIEGKSVDLERYRGKVSLVVNVASRCGLTPQYTQLVELDKKYRESGLRVLGFPANNFMGQEPGTNEQIQTFCSTKFGVEFDMFAKISVKGKDQHELYKFLTDKAKHGEYGGAIGWNFDKFLVDGNGKVIGRFSPRTKPNDPKVVAAIEAALKANRDAAADAKKS